MLSFRRRLGGSYRERRSGLWHELGARSQARDSGTRYFIQLFNGCASIYTM